jgi:ParB-like nuclease domain
MLKSKRDPRTWGKVYKKWCPVMSRCPERAIQRSLTCMSNPDRICTSHIERQNGSLRQWCNGGFVVHDALGRVSSLQVRVVPIDQLIPYIRNSRTHTDAQVALVAASISEFGWTNPILIRPDLVVIAGHARLLAGRKLGLTEVPVIELSGLSEAQCRALAIADNQLAIVGAGWDEEMLRIELAAVQFRLARLRRR